MCSGVVARLMSMPPKVAQLGLIPRLLKKLHKLPIYQEVEKVSGNVFVTDDLVSVSKSSNIFLAYVFLV